MYRIRYNRFSLSVIEHHDFLERRAPVTLHDLYEQIVSTFTPSTQKDLKTAVLVLARALQYDDPRACPLAACLHPLPAIYRLVEAHLTALGKKRDTLKNVKN